MLRDEISVGKGLSRCAEGECDEFWTVILDPGDRCTRVRGETMAGGSDDNIEVVVVS